MSFRPCMSQRKCRLLILPCSVLCAWIIWRHYYDILMYIKCSDYRSQQILETTCEFYRKGLIVGNLCPLLCDEHKVTYTGCKNHKGGKSVLVMSCDDACVSGQVITVMIKTQTNDNVDIYKNDVIHGLDNEAFIPSTLSGLRKYLKKLIWEKYALKLSDSIDVIKLVFQSDYHKYVYPSRDQKFKPFVNSILSLVKQNEYLITKLFQNVSFFPRIYHSCGGLYVIEAAPPNEILNPPLEPWRYSYAPWPDRAKAALELLEITVFLDSRFHQTLHMCDVKGENLGLGVDGKIKLIDTDDMFFEDNLLQIMNEKKPCKINHDCNVVCECHGYCSQGKCELRRINNNLQSLCFRILMPQYFRTSLLRDPPDSIKQELQAIFKLCLPPFDDPRDEQISPKIYSKLYNLIKSTL